MAAKEHPLNLHDYYKDFIDKINNLIDLAAKSCCTSDKEVVSSLKDGVTGLAETYGLLPSKSQIVIFDSLNQRLLRYLTENEDILQSFSDIQDGLRISNKLALRRALMDLRNQGKVTMYGTTQNAKYCLSRFVKNNVAI